MTSPRHHPIVQQLRRAGSGIRSILLGPKYERYTSQLSFSQQGEDRILDCIFSGQVEGFYVDVGAHHPERFSNTQLFYLRGWRGINIDPLPGSMELFNRLRPRDVNLAMGIALSPQSLTYYSYDEPAVNTFSPAIAAAIADRGQFKLVSMSAVPCYSLSDVLTKHLPANQTIDFLSVDAEGLDAEVLLSNDWDRYRPRVVLVEDIRANTLDQVVQSELARLLAARGYTPFSKMVHSQIYLDTVVLEQLTHR